MGEMRGPRNSCRCAGSGDDGHCAAPGSWTIEDAAAFKRRQPRREDMTVSIDGIASPELDLRQG